MTDWLTELGMFTRLLAHEAGHAHTRVKMSCGGLDLHIDEYFTADLELLGT